MTARTSSSTAARSRPILICRAACAATSIHGPRAIGPRSAFRVLRPISSISRVTGFVSDEGHLAAKLEASYDLLITNRLILQPQIEVDLYSKADPARLIGAGFSSIDTGLRLRYEFSRKFAPYLGVVYEGNFGQTASYARRMAESTGDFRFAFGVRIWF